MKDGDYHDIWLATAFALAVLLVGKFILGESEIAAWLVIIVGFTGGTLIMQHIGDRERRRHGEGD